MTSPQSATEQAVWAAAFAIALDKLPERQTANVAATVADETVEALRGVAPQPEVDPDPRTALEDTRRCLRRLLQDREAMLATLTETQKRCTEITERVREIDRRSHVEAFFRIANQPERQTPGVPDEAELRLGLDLIIEEVGELLDACLDEEEVKAAVATLRWHAKKARLRVRMVPLVDATIDTDYVIEGLRRRLGVNGDPIWTEVHAKNLAKRGGPKDPVTGKQLKPEGWTPPDIERLLREQGWKGDE